MSRSPSTEQRWPRGGSLPPEDDTGGIARVICKFVSLHCDESLYSTALYNKDAPARARGKMNETHVLIRSRNAMQLSKCIAGRDIEYAEERKNHSELTIQHIHGVVCMLCRKLREAKAPHTQQLPLSAMRAWDVMYASVLLFSIFREQPSIGWERAMIHLMTKDLLETQPYDGSDGPVKELYSTCLDLPDVIHAMAMGRYSDTDSTHSHIIGKANESNDYNEHMQKPLNRTSDSLWRAFLSKNPNVAGDHGSLDVSGAYPHSPWSALKHHVSPLLLGDIGLDGWTLMHFLASTIAAPVANLKKGSAVSAQNRVVAVLLAAGVRLVEKDISGRTPLHVACSVLHTDMILCLIAHGSSVLLEDAAGCTALDTFMRTLGVCNWRYYNIHSSQRPSNHVNEVNQNCKSFKKCTSEQLAQCIISLTGYDSERFWRILHVGREGARALGASCAGAYASNPLVLAIQFGDSVVIKTVVSASKMCPKAHWHLNVVRHCLLLAIRGGRVWLVEFLWNSYAAVLDDFQDAKQQTTNNESSIVQWVFFMQNCMAAAAISNSCSDSSQGESGVEKHADYETTNSVYGAHTYSHTQNTTAPVQDESRIASKAMLEFLFRRILHIRMTLDKSGDARKLFEEYYCKIWLPFLHVSVLRTGSQAILETFLNSDCIFVHHVIGTLSANTVGGDIAGLSRFWVPFAEREGVHAACQMLSPLALAFHLHDNAAAAKLLSFILLTQKGTPLSTAQCSDMIVSPCVACALSCNFEGLLLLREHMGAAAFTTSANTPDGSGVVALHALLHIICEQRRVAVSRLGEVPAIRSRTSYANPYQHANLKTEASILTLQLDSEAVMRTITLLLEYAPVKYLATDPCFCHSVTDTSVWVMRRDQLHQRLEKINIRIGQIVLSSGDATPNVNSTAVIAYLDKLLAQESRYRKDEIFRSIQQSLQAWDNLQHAVGTNGTYASEGSTDDFSFNMRALHASYTPRQKHPHTSLWAKLVQCVTLVLEREVYGNIDSGKNAYTGASPGDAWKRLCVIIGGHKGASRSSVTRKLLELQQNLVSFRDPFISELVSGRSFCPPGTPMEPNSRRVIGKETWLLLHRLMPHPATNFTICGPDMARTDEMLLEVPARVIKSAQGESESTLHNLSPRVGAAFETLHEWLKTIYNDGNILYSGVYDLSTTLNCAAQQANGLTQVIELLSLVEGRTRAEAALQRFPQVSPASEEPALSVLLGVLLQSSSQASSSNQCFTFLPLTQAAHQPPEINRAVRASMEISSEATYAGLRPASRFSQPRSSYSMMISLAEEVAVILIDTLVRNRNIESAKQLNTPACISPACIYMPVLRSQFLSYLASCGMWNAAIHLLQACKEGLVVLEDADRTVTGGKSHLSGYPTMLAGSRSLDEMDYVGRAGLSAEVYLSPEEMNASLDDASFTRKGKTSNGWMWSWADGDIFSLTEVHPLHFAIRANTSEASIFIEAFFAAFPDTSLDALSLAMLARHCGACGDSAHGSTFERVLALSNILEVPVTTDLQAVYFTHGTVTLGLTLHGVRRGKLRGSIASHALRANGRYKALPDYELACMRCAETALFHAMTRGVEVNAMQLSHGNEVLQAETALAMRVGISDAPAVLVVPQTGGQLQGLCAFSKSFSQVSSQTGSNSGGPGARMINGAKTSILSDTSPRIAMMDGTSIPYSQFHSSVYPLLRALPMPVVACGVNQSGHTLLHSLSECQGLYLAHRLMNKGVWRTLAVDRYGYTPVHNALAGGDLGLATGMLDQVIKQTCEPEPIHRIHARHSALPHRDIISSKLQQHATSQRQAAERNYFGGGCIKDAESVHSTDSLDTASLESRGLNLTTVTSSLELLVYTMHRAAVAWRHIAKQDFSRLLQLSRSPKVAPSAAPSAEGKSNMSDSNVSNDIALDSIVRARALLDLLRVPISQLPLSAAGPQSGSSPRARASPLSSLWDRISPSLLQERVSIKSVSLIKSQLLGWYMRRNKNSSNCSAPVPRARKVAGIEAGRVLQLGDEFFLRHALDKSCVQLGVLSRSDRASAHTEYADWERDEQSAASSRDFAGAEYKDHYDKSYIGFGESRASSMVTDKKMHDELIFKRHSSTASQNLMHQLVIETRAGEFTKKYTDEYFVPGGATSFIQEQALEAEKLVQFMKQWRADASGLQQALLLSYKILDFSRLLYLARTLVFMTSVPPSSGDSSGPWEHLLEIRYRHWRACIHYELQVKRIALPAMKSDSNSSPIGGPRLRICDLLDATDLAHFFRTTSSVSVRFAALRGLVTRSIICCCLMFGHDALASFIGQVSSIGSPDAATALPASAASLLAMRVDVNDENSTCGLETLLSMFQKLTVQSILARSKDKDSSSRADCARELTILAKALQNFDLDTSVSLSLGGLPTVQPVKPKRNGPAGSIPGYLSDNKAALARPHCFGAIDGNGTRSATDTNADERAVFGVVSTTSEIDSAHVLGGRDAVEELHKAYSTANTIGWMIQAIAGIVCSGTVVGGVGFLAGGRTISPSAIYGTLVQDWRQLSNLRNPLCLVSLPAGLLETFQQRQRQWLGQLSEYRQHRLATLLCADRTHGSIPAEALSLGSLTGWKLPPYVPFSEWFTHGSVDAELGSTCCAQLLELGCQPAAMDGNKSIPLALAAILGRPRMLQEMLQYSTDSQLEKLDYLQRYLCWHIIMASPADDVGSSALDCSDDPVMVDGSAAAFETCVRMLRTRGFSFDCPNVGSAHLSCLHLALLKRLKWVTMAICEEMQSAPSDNLTPTEDESVLPSFSPLHLAVVWPGIQLDMLARVIDCLSSQAILSDPLRHFSMTQILCAESIEQDIQTHAKFMAQQCGVESDTKIATSIMRDACMGLVVALESSFSPHEREGVTTECALWRAARVNIGQLLLLAVDAVDSSSTLGVESQSQNSIREDDITMTPSKRAGKVGSPSPSKWYGRLTPGKTRQLQHDTSRLQSDLKSTATDWNLFDLVVCTRRKDITNMIFRRYRLYGESTSTIPATSQRYSSPLRLSLLGCFYNSPHVLLAVALYTGQHEQSLGEGGLATENGDKGILGMRNLLGMREHLALAFTRRDGAVTPLEVACLYGYSDVVQYLVGVVGVEVPWLVALDALIYSRIPEAECLLLFQANIESSYVVRNHQSSQSDNNLRLIPLALSQEEPAEIHALCRLLNTPVRSLLLELPRDQKGVSSEDSPSVVTTGETLLHFCARRGHARLIRFLIDNGTSVHVQDAHGYIPLQVAITFGHANATRIIGAEHPHLRRSMQWLCMHVRCWLLRRQARRSDSVKTDQTIVDSSVIDKPNFLVIVTAISEAVKETAIQETAIQETTIQDTVIQETVIQETAIQETAIQETAIQRAEREAEVAFQQAAKNHANHNKS